MPWNHTRLLKGLHHKRPPTARVVPVTHESVSLEGVTVALPIPRCSISVGLAPLSLATQCSRRLRSPPGATMKALRVQNQQLPTESKVPEDKVLPGTENADQTTEEMSERHDHSRNHIGKVRIELCPKSFILQVYDVLARHTVHCDCETLHSLHDLSPDQGSLSMYCF
jgi:hypothetical protein